MGEADTRLLAVSDDNLAVGNARLDVSWLTRRFIGVYSQIGRKAKPPLRELSLSFIIGATTARMSSFPAAAGGYTQLRTGWGCFV